MSGQKYVTIQRIRKTVLANTCVVVYCCGVAIMLRKETPWCIAIPT